MLTLFSIPKACHGHIGIIQQNAFESWKRLGEQIQIILLGNDPGVAEAAAKHGFQHVPKIQLSKLGVPLISSIFEQAQMHAQFQTLCYVNADIILLPDFIPAIKHKPAQGLLVGQRWNLDITSPINFQADWSRALRQQAQQEGTSGGKYAIDYFVFPRGIFGRIPPFAIGRFYWDNWLLFRARNRKATIIDASHDILAIHQNHGYGEGESLSEREFRKTPAVALNKRLTGGHHHGLDLHQADARIIDGRIVQRGWAELGLRNALISQLALYPGFYRIYDALIYALESTVPEAIKRRLRPLFLRP